MISSRKCSGSLSVVIGPGNGVLRCARATPIRFSPTSNARIVEELLIACIGTSGFGSLLYDYRYFTGFFGDAGNPERTVLNSNIRNSRCRRGNSADVISLLAYNLLLEVIRIDLR